MQISDNKHIDEIKNEIIKLLEISKKISAYEISKNGFINIKFSETHLQNLATLNIEKRSKKEHILFDYGGPNIGKALHVGHLRTLNSGRSLYNINKFAGNKVTSDVHFGDWGMPYHKLLHILSIRIWI